MADQDTGKKQSPSPTGAKIKPQELSGSVDQWRQHGADPNSPKFPWPFNSNGTMGSTICHHQESQDLRRNLCSEAPSSCGFWPNCPTEVPIRSTAPDIRWSLGYCWMHQDKNLKWTRKTSQKCQDVKSHPFRALFFAFCLFGFVIFCQGDELCDRAPKCVGRCDAPCSIGYELSSCLSLDLIAAIRKGTSWGQGIPSV